MKIILKKIKGSFQRKVLPTAPRVKKEVSFDEITRYTERHFGRAIVKLSDR